MDITKTQTDGKTVYALNGRLDATSAQQFQDVLLDAVKEAHSLELDFSGVTYVSSAGLRVLLLGEKSAKVEECAMNIVHVKPEVMEIFELTGFREIFKIA